MRDDLMRVRNELFEMKTEVQAQIAVDGAKDRYLMGIGAGLVRALEVVDIALESRRRESP